VSTAGFILAILIVASPAVLPWGGLIAQGAIAGTVAVGLLMAALRLRAAEARNVAFLVRPVAIAAAVPALWIVFQVLPVSALAHPIWASAASALGHSLPGHISLDLGVSVISLGRYLAFCATTLLAVAVAVDRSRAETLLFALTTAGSVSALLLFAHVLFPGFELSSFAQMQAIDCAGFGAIIAGATCIRTIERYETRRAHPKRSELSLRWALTACGAALAICLATLVFAEADEVLVAVGCGLAVLGSIAIIRHLGLNAWLTAIMTAPILAIAVLLLASHPIQPGISRLLAFSTSPIGETERILDDAPLVGTGAGTFHAVASIYRAIDDPAALRVAPTTVASLAIELGRPMLALIAAVVATAIVMFLRASLVRGRDSFYPAMGAGCLVCLCLLAFVNNGLVGNAAGLIIAGALGLALAQSKSRTVQSG
jgi:hypothetical protein